MTGSTVANLNKGQLFQKILDGIHDAGWTVTIKSSKNSHPLRFAMERNGATRHVRAYIWNLTHGGGKKRPKHEYRIQITGVGAFEKELDAETLILGWDPASGVFAGFDVDRHMGKLGSSPSIQTAKATLETAAQHGIAIQSKSNNELAVAVRPDLLASYIAQRSEAHSGDLNGIPPGAGPIGQEPPAVEPEDVDLISMAVGNAPRHLGSPAERRQRASVLARLEALERDFEAIRPHLDMMGHNQPPEPIEPDPQILAEEVTNTSGAIRLELAEEEPDLEAVAKKATVLQGISKLLAAGKDQAVKAGHLLVDKATDKIAEAIVVSALGAFAIYAPSILNALRTVLGEIHKWFQMIF